MKLRHAVLGIMFGLSGTAQAVTLSEAITEALATNPDVLAAEAREAAGVDALRGAQAGYYPQVEMTGGSGMERTDNSTTQIDRTLDRHEFAVNASQMLFDGWRTYGQEERAQARLEGAGFGLDDARRATMLRVVEVYLDVLNTRELQRYAADNLELHQEVGDQIRARSRTGISRRSDLEQVEGREARAQSALIAADYDLADAMARYLRVVGDLPEEMAPVTDSDCEAIPATMDATLKLAFERHPGLQEAMADYRAALAEERIALSAMMPELHAELSTSRNDDIDGVDNINEDTLYMLRARYNVLNGGLDEARMKEVRHFTDEARERVEQERRRIEEQIRLAWHAYQAANVREPLLEERSIAQQQTEKAYSRQFQVGQRTLLDLLDVGTELFTANAEYAQIRYDRLAAGYRLLAEIGVLGEVLGLASATVE